MTAFSKPKPVSLLNNFRGKKTECSRRYLYLFVSKSNTTELINNKYNQMQKNTYFMILFISDIQNTQIHRESGLMVA